MTAELIPEPVRTADAVHHALLGEVSFSRHLNPINEGEARRAFLSGRKAEPPFAYLPLVQADELLWRLDAAEPPRDHPAGALVGSCMDSTRQLIVALRDRSAEAFDSMARSSGWYPDADLLGLQFDESERDESPIEHNAPRLIAHLREALDQRGLIDWIIAEDPVMAARVLVDGAKRVIRVKPDARFRHRDLDRLVVHEIDVHVQRTVNGQAQALRCFETGLPDSLATEEGLAMQAEQRAGVANPGVLSRQVAVVKAIDLGRTIGFRELYEHLSQEVGSALAWGIGLRIKRGLAHPGRPGVYAKDSVYLSGWKQVGDWLEAGGDIRQLYVGKVGLHDPIEHWAAQGWLSWQAVPPLWYGGVGRS